MLAMKGESRKKMEIPIVLVNVQTRLSKLSHSTQLFGDKRKNKARITKVATPGRCEFFLFY